MADDSRLSGLSVNLAGRGVLARRSVMLATLVAGLVIVLTAAFWDYTQDDVFITFAYARNIAEGHGFVFNLGERVQGTTTPLYTLVMAAAYRVTSDLLHAGNVLSALCLLLTAALAWDLTRERLSWGARAAIVLTISASPLVYVSFGMETLLVSALLLLALWRWSRGHLVQAMLAAAALTWTRADGVVLAAALGLSALVDQRHTPSARHLARLALAYLAGILPWLLFAWWYFGTPLPQTFSAKQALLQGTLFWTDGAQWWKSFYGNNPLMLLALPLGVWGLARTLADHRFRPAALWVILYALGYTALNVTAFWYYTSPWIVFIIMAGFGADGFVEWAARLGRWSARAAILATALVAITTGLAVGRSWSYRLPPPRMATYRLVGTWIAQHTDPTARLMVRDLGLVGYYAQRPTIDSYGLIVPDMYVFNDSYAVAKYKPDLVVTTQYWEMKAMAAQDWFNAQYRPLAQFSTPGDVEFSPMTVYERRLALETPTQSVTGFDLPLTCRVDVPQGGALPTETRAALATLDGEILVDASHPFLWGQYPAERAMNGESFVEQIALPLEAPPGHYRWTLSCDREFFGEVEVLPFDRASAAAPADFPPWSTFARLESIAFPDGLETWSGGSLSVALQWGAAGPADRDYSVMVHLVDAEGRLVAQADGFPRGRPVTSWLAGEAVVDVRPLRLPANLPEGMYRLVLGWYDWRDDTHPRVPLASGGDVVTLPVEVTGRWPGGSGAP